MFALDLFNTDHERRLTEGAVDTLEQRRIDDLAMKMDDLVARAKKATTPEVKQALMKEFQKCKDERDSYYKIREGEVTPTATGLKHRGTKGYGADYNGSSVGSSGTNSVAPSTGRRTMPRLDHDANDAPNYEVDEEVADSYNTKQVKVFKDKSGKPIGEIGFDLDASPGNDDWYCWHYATGYNVLGFENAAEATRELKYVHKHPEAVSEAGIPGNVPVEKIPGKEDLLKGKGRSYYEADQKKNSEVNKDQRLHVGDPVVVTGPNEFEGKTGEISEFSPSGKFVVVNLYNHGEHSMHLSDVKYNDYADQQDDWYDEEDFVDEDQGAGQVAIKAADDAVVDTMDEGWSNKMVARRTGQTPTPYSVYIKGKEWKSFPDDDHAENVANKLRAKFQADGRDPGVITIAPTGYDKDLKEFAPSPERDDNDDVPDQIVTLANRWWNAAGDQPKIESVLRSLGWSIHQVESEDDAVQLQHNDGTTYFLSADDFDPEVFEEAERRVDPILIKALNNMPDGLADHHSVLDAAYDAYAMELGKMRMKSEYGTTRVYIPKLMDLYKQKHGLTFKEEQGVAEGGFGRDEEFLSRERNAGLEHETNNIQIAINGKPWKVVSGKGYADSAEERAYLEGMKRWAEKKSAATGKKWTVYLTGASISEAKTDYSKRRQREKDIDTGKPVAKQRQPRMTDYQKKRAQDKKDMELGEDQDTSGVESAIIRRIMVAHTDLLKQFGPEKVMQAAEEVAYNVGDVDEIGTSDVSAYVNQVKQILGAAQ